MEAPSIQLEVPSTPSLDHWFSQARETIDQTLDDLLVNADEAPTDERWVAALAKTREYTGRPGKRLRPALLLAGYALGGGKDLSAKGLYEFASGIEILHTFMLIHDDIADDAETRRGGEALHHVYGDDKHGENLAVVMGDYLFARGVEVMLASGLPRAAQVAQYYLSICRQAAAGQYLDLEMANVDLADAKLFQLLRVAKLKTADPSFTAPMVAGAMLAGADQNTVHTLDRIGRNMGIAFQLRDDVLGLFGESQVAGKPCDCDLVQGKRTFPLIASYLRAPADIKQELEDLWSRGENHNGTLKRAQNLIREFGGLDATQKAVDRMSKTARGALKNFPADNPFCHLLDKLINLLIRRDY